MRPLREAIRDSDPYVRKTAAICISKLFAHSSVLVEQSTGVQDLYHLLQDGNATVMASAVVALLDIHRKTEKYDIVVDSNLASRLLTAINDCNEYVDLSYFVPLVILRHG